MQRGHDVSDVQSDAFPAFDIRDRNAAGNRRFQMDPTAPTAAMLVLLARMGAF